MQKSNKDIFLVCQINFIKQWYDEEYMGHSREVMKDYHVKVMEQTYFPNRFGRPGHPTKDEKEEFMNGIERIVRETAGQHFADHDLWKNLIP